MEVSTTLIAGSCITGGKEWMVYGNVHEASVFAISFLRNSENGEAAFRKVLCLITVGLVWTL